MVNNYNLINPHIKGEFKTSIKAKNSYEAANTFYSELSKNFNNSVPEFNFTIQKGVLGKGKFYHFNVKELRSNKNNNQVNYSLKSLNIDDEKLLNKFKENLNTFKENFNQATGGKKHNNHKKHKKKKSKHDESDKKSDDESESSESSNSSDTISESILDTENIYRRIKSYTPEYKQIYYWWYDPYVYNLNSVYIPTFYSYITPYIEISLPYVVY
jgi:hypothetical protein